MELKRRKTLPASISDKWEIITSSEDNCFVCDKPLFKKGKKVGNIISIGRHKIHKTLLRRHESCCPGSVKWEKKFNVKHSSIFQQTT